MTNKQKRFQTGREIMKTYVPNYEPPTRPFDAQEHLGARSGNDLVQVLLREFTKRLSKKKLRMESQRPASNGCGSSIEHRGPNRICRSLVQAVAPAYIDWNE